MIAPLELKQPSEPKQDGQKEEEHKDQTTDVKVLCATEMKRSRVFSVTPKLSKPFLIILLVCLVQGVHNSSCPDGATRTKVESQRCVSNGIIINKLENGDLCWTTVSCPTGHLNGQGKCQEKCACPRWAQGCSFYEGPLPEIKNVDKILDREKPNVCSIEPDKRCNEQPTHAHFDQIQLFNGSTYYVNELNLQESEVTSKEFECVGTGPVTGSEAYCANNPCESTGTKFCYEKNNPVMNFVSDTGKIPIKAWGTVPVKFYAVKMAPPQNPTCYKCSLICVKGGVELRVDKNIGRVEICAKPLCYVLQFPREKELMLFPPEVTLHKHTVEAKIWSNGYLIKNLVTDCESLPFCEEINCYFCWDLLVNPQCAPRMGMILIFILIYFSSISVYVVLKIVKVVLENVFGYFFSGLHILVHKFGILTDVLLKHLY